MFQNNQYARFLSGYIVFTITLFEAAGILESRFDTTIDTVWILCPVVVVSQGTKLQKTANQAFLQLLKRLHNNDISMVLNSLKVFQVRHSFYVNIKILIAFQTLLDPITVEKVLSDTNSKPQKMDWFSKIFGRKESVDVKSFREMLIDRNHKTSTLRTNLAIIQDDENRIEFNCLFYDWELSLHDKDIAKTHLCLQVCILQF